MSATAPAQFDDPYRWVMAIVSGLVVATSFISLTAFGVAAPSIAKTIGIPVHELTTCGVDAFSIGLFVAFFLGHGGLFDTRIRLGVLVSQVLLIVPHVLIPVLVPATRSLALFTALRFLEGLVIMMVALFAVQLSGWFRPGQRAVSLCAVTGSTALGGALGGLITGQLHALSWQDIYYVTAAIMLGGAALYFILARDPPGFAAELAAAKARPHEGAWRRPITWIMGAAQIPLTWTLFTIGGYLPAYAFHLHYSEGRTGSVMFVWGVVGFFGAVIGALLGDGLARRRSGNRAIVNARLAVMSLGNLGMAAGALMILYLAPLSYGVFLLSAVVIAVFMMMIPPNFWASPSSIYTYATVGGGAFGMGVISNSTSAVGPVVSSALVPSLGWSGVFWIIAVLGLVGVGVNALAMRTPLVANEG